MFKYILIATGIFVGLIIYFALTAPPPVPTVYYNNSGLFILSQVKINGTPYKMVRISVDNMSIVTGIEVGNRRYTYVVGYYINWLYYDGVNKYAIVEIKNLGNATLYFGKPIRLADVVRIKDPPLPPPPTVNITSTVLQCSAYGCQVNLRARLVAPYDGQVPISIVMPGDVRSMTVQLGKDIMLTVTVPYGSRIELSTPWGSNFVEVRPNITAWFGDYNLTCVSDNCYYLVRIHVASEVSAQVKLVGPNREYYVSIFKPSDIGERMAKSYTDITLMPGETCMTVVPTGQSLCAKLPYMPPGLRILDVRWVYYSPTDVLAIIRAYNPGHATLRSDIYCDNCGPPDGDQQNVLRELAYGAMPLPRTLELRPLSYTTIAIRVASSGGALVLLHNNTRYLLVPPPLPKVKYVYNVSIMPGSPPNFNIYGWTITRYAVVTIRFDRQDVVYKNFVYAYSGNMTCPVTCSGQICATYIPLEAVKTVVFASPPNGWRVVNSTAWPSLAYVATPWGIIRVG